MCKRGSEGSSNAGGALKAAVMPDSWVGDEQFLQHVLCICRHGAVCHVAQTLGNNIRANGYVRSVLVHGSLLSC